MPLFAPDIEKLEKRRDVRALVRLLERHHSADIRLAAAQALGKIGAAEAVEPLLRALPQADSRVRLAIVVALARLGDQRAVDPFVALLADPQACAYAIRGLVRLRATQAVPALIAVRDTDPQNRRLAIQALAALNEPRVVQPLIQDGAFPPDLVQATAAALLDLGAPAVPVLLSALHIAPAAGAVIDVLSGIGAPAVEPLIQATHEGPDRTRSAAAQALARIGEPALGPLIEELGHRWGLGRRNELAAQALGQMGDPRAVEPLSEALRTADSSNRLFRRELVAALGRIGSDQALPALRLALRDPDSDLRQAAARALAEYGRAETAGLLRGALQDAAPDVRAAAARGLGRLGDVVAVEELGQRLLDTDPGVGRAAAQALADIGGPLVVTRLAAALRNPHCVVRVPVAAGLLAEGSVLAWQTLIELEHDADPSFRQMALQARVRLDGTNAVPALVAALQDLHADVRSTAAAMLDDLHWKPDRDDLQARYLVARQQWNEAVALGPAAVGALEGVLPDQQVRAPAGAALERLAWRPPARDVAAAHFWIEQRRWDRCIEIGSPAVEPLIEVLQRGDRDAPAPPWEAVHALGQIGGLEAGQALILALEHAGSSRLELEIVTALAEFNLPTLDASILPLLLDRLDHPDPDVRRSARRGADARHGPQMLPVLIQTLGHRRWPVRQYAAAALLDLYRSGQLDATALDVIRGQRAQMAAVHVDRGQDRPHEDETRAVEGWCVAHVDEAAQTHTDTGIGLSFDL